MRNKKIYTMVSLSLLLFISSILVIYRSEPKSYDYTQIKNINFIDTSQAIDINNPKEVIGFADYVFVAKIIEQKGTIYEDVRKTFIGRKKLLLILNIQ